MELNTVYNEDCIKGMERIGDKSIDLILTDLPYGVTDCKWDNIIPFPKLWEQYNRIIKDNGAIVLFSIQPFTISKEYKQQYTNYPVHLLQFNNEAATNKNRLHPTQKPVALCEYLIKTYTNVGGIVLDSCAGSGTTLLAAKNTGRNYIGFETDEYYYKVILERLTEQCDGTQQNKKGVDNIHNMV